MAYTTLIQDYDVSVTTIDLKFSRTPRVSSLVNAAFEVEDISGATPTTISNPFQTINLQTDYSSISRLLTLVWNEDVLEAETEYRLTVSGLVDSAGLVIPDESITFTTGEDTTMDESEIPVEEPVVIIEDHSIKTEVFTSGTIITSSGLSVTGSDPSSGEYIIETDHNNGRVTIKFSEDPQAQYINSTYFKAQRKPIQRTPVRWERLGAVVSKHSNKPWVFVDFPSLTDEDVYTTSGYDYFEENYKYRVIISSEVSS